MLCNYKIQLTHKFLFSVILIVFFLLPSLVHGLQEPKESNQVENICDITPFETQRGFVKWNPGHYIMIPSDLRKKEGGSFKLIQDFVRVYKDVTEMRGVQKTYYWSELETAPGIYNFKMIDRDIAELATYNKKLSIMIQYRYRIYNKKLGISLDNLPNYILKQANATVNSVTVAPYYTQGRNSENINMANFGHPGTFIGFKNLLTAISKRYDNNSSFSSITFPETANGFRIRGNSYKAKQERNFINGQINIQRHAGCVFRHTPIFQNLNYPRKALKNFIENFKSYGLGFGGPDVFFEAMEHSKKGLGFKETKNSYAGVYHYYPRISGILPIGQQVHYKNFLYSTAESKSSIMGTPHGLPAHKSLDSIYNFSLSQLKPNYMFWQVLKPTNLYARELEKRLKSRVGLPLKKDCPIIYSNKCSIINSKQN